MHSARKPRVWLISSLLLLVVLLAACTGGGTNATPTPTAHPKAPDAQQVYVSSYEEGSADFGTLDPALVGNVNDIFVTNSIFVGLVDLNDQGLIHCELCSSYSVSPDGLTWTFTLRPGLTFSDGTPLTSADVVYSINLALDPATQSGLGLNYLGYIKDAASFAGGSKNIKTLIGDSLLALDAQTVKVIVVGPVAFFLDALAFPTSQVVERSVIQRWGVHWTDHLSDNGGQGGAGPWKMLSYVHKKQAVLVPNPNYWGPKPQLRKAVYPFFPGVAAYSLYLVNQLDDAGVGVADIDRARARSDFHQVPQLSMYYYSMNYDIKPFDVVACRLALALALNKTLIVQSVWKGILLPTNHIVPQGMYGYSLGLTGPDGTTSTIGNPTQARADLQACMAAQGYHSLSQFPSITLTYSSGGSQQIHNETATMRQEWQDTLGISVTLNDIDLGTLLASTLSGCGANHLQFWWSNWTADYPDPQDFTTLQFDKGEIKNAMCYGQNNGPSAAEQQQVQAELEAADTNSNPTARLAVYHQAEQALVNDVAWLPMEQQLATLLRKPCLQGWTDTSYEEIMPDQDWSKVYISTDRPCIIPS